MSLGASPLDARGVASVIDRKMADFRHKARRIELRHVCVETYLDVARDDPDVRLALETGFIGDLEADLRDPVIVRVDDHEVFTCPPLATRVLADEPPELHRPFVEGAFFRQLFRFFVPATHEGAPSWEAVEQVRQIMQQHFAFQLIAVETVLGDAA